MAQKQAQHTNSTQGAGEPRKRTPTFLLELPLLVEEGQAKRLRAHLEAVLAQPLASRAYQALNRVCLGEARRVRFKSRGRGLGSIENKRNDTGPRFLLQKPEEGQRGFFIWQHDHLEALIDWNDPVIKHGLDHRAKYAHLVQRKASRQKAREAAHWGDGYVRPLRLAR